jgi:hypothetical protein
MIGEPNNILPRPVVRIYGQHGPTRHCHGRSYAWYRTDNKISEAYPTIAMGTLSHIPRKSTSLFLFDKAVWRLVDNTEGVSQLSESRLAAVTEELNRIADEIWEASTRLSTSDDAALGRRNLK